MSARRAQSLVEFALVAPIVILLAMAAWDGGSILREQVVLQQAARDGARVGATTYGGAQQSVIQDAVLASSADLPSLSSTPNYLSVTNGAQSITVQLRYGHTLITPVIRQLWGGAGTLMLSASATFYVPQLTPSPVGVVASTPIPTATPTPTATVVSTPTSTPTPTATVTPTAAPVLPNPCSAIPNAQSLPAMSNNTGYWCTVRLITASILTAYWQNDANSNNQIQIYASNPFAGQSDPSSLAPPAGSLATDVRPDTGLLWGYTGCIPPGTYTVYFFNRGAPIPASDGNVTAYDCSGFALFG